MYRETIMYKKHISQIFAFMIDIGWNYPTFFYALDFRRDPFLSDVSGRQLLTLISSSILSASNFFWVKKTHI